MQTVRKSVDVRFSRFDLVDPDVRMTTRTSTEGGLLNVAPGHIHCRTGILARRVHVTVELAATSPDDALDAYEDVVESTYASANGSLTLVDWTGRSAGTLPPLPAGPGEYRVRYHVRGTDSGEDGECLLQLWSSAARPATELKISSETGQFWHPLARLTAPITEAKYWQRRAREHDTGLERD